MSCYTELDHCLAKVATLKETLKTFDEAQLEIKPEMFSQWCDLYQAGVYGVSVKGIIAGLLEIADTELNLSKVADSCAMAQTILMEKRELDLSGKGVGSLLPLVSFQKNLIKLNLAHNAIYDIDVLAKFSKLKELDLNANGLESILPLTGLAQLKTLKLATNKLEDLPDIRSLSRLETLWLGYNHIHNLGFLSGVPQVKRLKLNNNGIKDITLLGKLKNLEGLDLSRNQINDLSPLFNLEKLRHLDLSENPSECPERW